MNDENLSKRSTAQENIKPKFEGGTSEGGSAPGGERALGVNEKQSSKDKDKNSSDEKTSHSAADTLNDAEKSATSGFYKAKGSQSAEDGEESPSGFYKFSPKNKKIKKGLFKGKFALASIGGVLFASVFAIGLIGIPAFLIGTIDMNLQDALGFTDTSAILEEQSEYVTQEMAMNGEIPNAFATDLANAGIFAGQVTASGDFVRTDTYIADIDKLTDIATMGHFQINQTEPGQLAFLFDNEVIDATSFVATVESNPVLYAAFSKAADISARYYYSDDVQKVYDDADISRNLFAKWEKTTDHETNMKTFNEIKDKALNGNSSLKVGGWGKTSEQVSFDSNTTFSNNSDTSARDIIEKTRDTVNKNNAKASELLNMAVSASEPYLAASAFMIVEEPIQRARIEGTGPVNELMDTLSQPTKVVYKDVETGETVTSEVPVLQSANFAAAISRGTYSKKEATNFSRDRILVATGNSNNENLITDTSVTTQGRSKSGIITSKGSSEDAQELIDNASSSVDIAITQKNSDLFASIVGGNRIVEGGSFLSNIINSKNIGAMPSDSSAVAIYNREVETVLARRANADRATLSPFDISSPHTFLGSIVHTFANSVLGNTSSTNPTVSGLSTISGLVKSSTNSLFNNTFADGETENKFTTIAGDCSTVKSAAKVIGDLYCTSHNTANTSNMKNTLKDWVNLGIGVDDSRHIEDKSELAEFIALGMDRDTTVGVKSADICEAAKKDFDKGTSSILDFFASLFGAYESCNNLEEGIGTGAKYTLSNNNYYVEKTRLYSGYALYDKVYSLLSNKKSSVSAYREAYYAAHPRDDSPAGKLARISGMSKEDATIALNYASYLNYIANYNPSTRYAFGAPIFTPPIHFQSPITPHDSSPILAIISEAPTKKQI